MPLNTYKTTTQTDPTPRHIFACTPGEAYDRLVDAGALPGECSSTAVRPHEAPLEERIAEIGLVALSVGVDPERLGGRTACPGDAERLDALEALARKASTGGINLAWRDGSDQRRFHVGLRGQAIEPGPTLRRAIDEAAPTKAETSPSGHDTARLDWLEAETIRSPTGVSLDWIPSCEGEASGYRFMRKHWIGEPKKTLRAAIDHAMAAQSPQPAF